MEHLNSTARLQQTSGTSAELVIFVCLVRGTSPACLQGRRRAPQQTSGLTALNLGCRKPGGLQVPMAFTLVTSCHRTRRCAWPPVQAGGLSQECAGFRQSWLPKQPHGPAKLRATALAQWC